MFGTIKWIQSTSIVFTLLLMLLSFVCSNNNRVELGDEMFEIVYSNSTILRDRVIEILNKYPNFVNKRFGAFDRTPLHMAIQNRNIHFIKLLLINYKAEPNIKDNFGWNAWRYGSHYHMLQELTNEIKINLEQVKTDLEQVKIDKEKISIEVKKIEKSKASVFLFNTFVIGVVVGYGILCCCGFTEKTPKNEGNSNNGLSRVGVQTQHERALQNESASKETECSICMDSKKEVAFCIVVIVFVKHVLKD
ncbi:hypothetical protein ABK040_010742 [Willaertia magna]